MRRLAICCGHPNSLRDDSNGRDTAKAVTKAFRDVINAAIDAKKFPEVLGKHSEMYRIVGTPYPDLVKIERFATSLFGIAARGVYLTAYVRDNDGSIRIWVSRRGAGVLDPNKRDMTAAGGIKAEDTPRKCVLEETKEEASLAGEFVEKNIRATGVITYSTQRMGLPYFCIMYGYEILLEDMTPTSCSPEVAGFELMSVGAIQEAMFGGEFRADCILFMVNFFMQHGIITAESEADYVKLATRLHRELPVPT